MSSQEVDMKTGVCYGIRKQASLKITQLVYRQAITIFITAAS
jgi:hypothetical protein